MRLAENLHVRLHHELLHAIDVFRRSEADLPTRQEAARRLLKQALTARQEEASLKNLVGVMDAP
jgi:hypothetical protein